MNLFAFVTLVAALILVAIYVWKQLQPRLRPSEEPDAIPRNKGVDEILRKAAVEQDRQQWYAMAKELARMSLKIAPELKELLDAKNTLIHRIVALRALVLMGESDAIECITAALRDSNETLRYEALCTLYLVQHWDLDLARKMMMEDSSALVASEAMWYLHYQAFDEAYQEALARRNDPQPRMRVIAAQILAEKPTLETFSYLLIGLLDTDYDTQNYHRQGVEKVYRNHTEGEVLEEIKKIAFDARRKVERYLSTINRDELLHALLELLHKAKGEDVDVTALAEFGVSLTELAKEGRLTRAHGLDSQIAFVMEMLTSQKRPSIVILGESGTGKTAFIHELAYRLAEDANSEMTHVFEVSTGQIMRGTIYLGEWQTKLLRFIEQIKLPKRVLWYLSNANDLLTAGTSLKSTESFFAVLQPFLERKEICIIGESSPQAFARGLGQNASARALFHSVNLQAKTAEETKTILQRVQEDLVQRSEQRGQRIQIPEEILERIIELAGNYFPNTAFPGKAVAFLRFLVQAELEWAEKNQSGTPMVLGLDTLYEVLSKLTGMPLGLIDDRQSLDLEKTRSFFQERILGQEEAITTVLDVVTLIKAGLTDPGKPMSVLFFVGPTGVGKTELAKSIAEYIFGSPDRMIRLDMSEYQDYQSIDRLIGTLDQTGILTGKVRQQPFSVILLDEIEKGHAAIFDLLLQVFDDGRLTDAQGVLTNFRQTIIVMTSNLGSQIQTHAAIGFDRKTFIPGEEKVLQQVRAFFRPEFINRIDKMIVFRPLDLQAMEKIARREIGKVLQRKGIASRRLVVDIDGSVVSLLLREGFSPEYGARPMKRSVERRLLVPIAQAIVTGEVAQPGDILRIGASENDVFVRVVKDKQEDEIHELKEHIRIKVPFLEGKPKISLLDCRNLVAELERRIQEMEALAEELQIPQRKSALIESTGTVSFWDEAEKARGALAQINHLESLQHSLGRVRRKLDDLSSQLKRVTAVGAEAKLRTIMERYLELKRDVDLTEFDFKCRDEIDRQDAYLTLTRVDGNLPDVDPILELYGMYSGWAAKKKFQTRILDDRVGNQDTLTFLIEGPCAYGLLKGENGLHCFLNIDRQRRKRHRGLIKVDVVSDAGPSSADLRAKDLNIESRTGKPLPGRILEKTRTEILLTHVPSMMSVCWRNELGYDQSLELLKTFLAARLAQENRPHLSSDSRRALPTRDLVRNYYLAPNKYIKDLNTGLKTYAYRQVMEGNIDEFLLASKS